MYVCTHIVSDCTSEEHTGSLIPLFSCPAPHPPSNRVSSASCGPHSVLVMPCERGKRRRREGEQEEGRKGGGKEGEHQLS